jgi:hypothetical protein
MLSRKKIKTSRYVAALAITLLIFMGGYMVSSEIDKLKLNKLSYLEQDLRVESLGSELVLQLIQNDLCGNVNSTAYTEELTTYGKRVTYLESLYGFSSEETARLKNYYSLLEIRHWMISNNINEKCNQNTPLVIYFYTNYGCEDCEDQGLVLTNVHKNYPLFNIYSFEYMLNNSAIDYLKDKYNISQNRLPALVIDNDVYYGFQSKDLLIKVMSLEQRLAIDKQMHPELYK